MYMTVPMFKMTEDRKKQLLNVVNTLTVEEERIYANNVGPDDISIEEIVEGLTTTINRYTPDILQSGEVGDFVHNELSYDILITAGQSWGDEVSDAAGPMEKLMCVDRMETLMTGFAREDKTERLAKLGGIL
tara:strand:- start:373 stop:768 length:396 start_codon:yes stop_codon:yes gene_type:complete